MNNYLQRAWSDPVDNITINDIDEVIAEIQQMDDEYGAFWVGVGEDDVVLEVDKDLEITAVFNNEDGNTIVKQADSWIEVKELYQILLNGQFDVLKQGLMNM